MKIIDSIKTSLFALTAFVSAAHGDTTLPLLSGDNWTLSSVCEAKYKCSTVKASGSNELARIDFPYTPISAKETHGIIEILFSCGTECSATYFILSDNSTSGPYALADTIDYEKGTLLSVGKHEFKIFKFSPAIKAAIKSIKVDIPNDTTLPSRVIDSKLVDHTYSITFKDASNKEQHINIEQ